MNKFFNVKSLTKKVQHSQKLQYIGNFIMLMISFNPYDLFNILFFILFLVLFIWKIKLPASLNFMNFYMEK